ncbi:hypothetical protein FSP39_018637 [Pinctada imbricata]|uniref:NR LBD domain-containing protein n=1 Tax=Pinctada imbricata TaxID=66713 RepID=A0AA88XN63_PINIB|nr:hypothetical protein FSP39_018637 [Pinctada imbricata]
MNELTSAQLQAWQISRLERESPRKFIENCHLSIVGELLKCGSHLEISNCYNLEDLCHSDSEVTEKLCRLGDNIVEKLVNWTRNLPFYEEIPQETRSQVLVNKWHPLLVLITTVQKALQAGSDTQLSHFTDLHQCNMALLDKYLSRMFSETYDPSLITKDVRNVMEKITHLMWTFMYMGLRREEYVCLQAILLMGDVDLCVILSQIQQRFKAALQYLVSRLHPHQPHRFSQLLLQLTEIETASAMLLSSKMIYIPFFLNDCNPVM